MPLRRWIPALVVGAIACESSPSYVIVHQPVYTVRVTPANDTIPFGGSVSLQAAVLDVNGDPTIPDHKPEWTSLNTAVLTVDTSGNVGTAWYGQGTIRAVVDGVEGDAEITVLVPPVVSVAVGPVGATPERGDTVRFFASARNSAGLPATINRIRWSSSDTMLLKIDSTGRAVALGIGPAQVTAAVDSVAGSTRVTVLVPTASVTVSPKTLTIAYDDTAGFQAQARDAAGNVVNDRIHLNIPDVAAAEGSVAGPNAQFSVHGMTPGAGLLIVSAGRVADTLSLTVAPLVLRSVAPGVWSTCGLAADSSAYCWGWGAAGQLGTGDSVTGPRPRRVVGGLKFASLTGGEDFTCGLTVDGSAWCWGANGDGRLGRPGPDTAAPAPVSGGHHFTMLSSEGATCGLTTAGQAYCWGPSWGASPVPVGTPGLFDRVTIGGGGYCGSRAADDSILCWNPQVVDPTVLNPSRPLVLQTNGQWGVTCGLSGGDLYCWGWWPITSDGSQGIPFTPRLGGTSFTLATDGGQFVCGITVSGAVRCMGNDLDGELGDGGGTFSDSLVAVRSPVPLVSIRAGYSHTCGMGADGLAYCWGYNPYGQAGSGANGSNLFENVLTPQPVMNQR